MDRGHVQGLLAELRGRIAAMRPRVASDRASAVDRVVGDLDAAAFHARPPSDHPVVVALVGGTGTGKSTLTNRLVDAGRDVTAASFRRTFTAGAVAVARDAASLPAGWLGLPHAQPPQMPARGEEGRLIVVTADAPLTRAATLVDTPDIDGDQPGHHASADRAFRWAQGVVFVVSPEKYQMSELPPYYRLAKRYGLPALFAMNKADERAIFDDYKRQLGELVPGEPVKAFVVPRDDATFAAEPAESVDGLRDAVRAIKPGVPDGGMCHRVRDVCLRSHDVVIEPLRALRSKADRAVSAMRSLRTPEAGVDVDPMTRSVRRRLQQKSVLYLMGPGRMLDHLKRVPAMLSRLPRSTADLLRGKRVAADDEPATDPNAVPDFRALTVDGFKVAQARIDDVLQQHEFAASEAWRLDPESAGRIVDEELGQLREWLEQRWNADPRDTKLIRKLLDKVPGAEGATRASELAPYLLVAYLATTSVLPGAVEAVVLGGYGLTTWLGERLSNEVTQRTREANRNIDARFAALVAEQVETAARWAGSHAPGVEELDAASEVLDRLQLACEGR